MKKIICFLLTFFCLFITYSRFNKKVINYVLLTDFNNNYHELIINNLNINNKVFINNFVNKTISELTINIHNNRTIRDENRDYYLKKSLRESDILIIDIGKIELFNNYQENNMDNNYHYFSKMYDNIEKLIKEINKYAKEKIFFIGYYNPTSYYDSKTDEFFYYLDYKLNNLMKDNNIIYINLYEIVKGNNYKISEKYLNIDGNHYISKRILSYLEGNT